MVIGRVYPGASTIHTVHDDLTRVVVEKVRDGSLVILVPTLEVKLVRETLGTFITWSTHLIRSILKIN